MKAEVLVPSTSCWGSGGGGGSHEGTWPRLSLLLIAASAAVAPNKTDSLGTRQSCDSIPPSHYLSVKYGGA